MVKARDYQRIMTGVIMVGDQPLALAKPSREEARVIRQFSHERESRLLFAEHVRAWNARIAENLDDTMLAARSIFDMVDVRLGKFATHELGHRDALDLLQPRLFARASKENVGNILELIRFAFSDKLNNDQLIGESSYRRFLRAAFWQEIHTVLSSELVTDAGRTLTDLLRMDPEDGDRILYKQLADKGRRFLDIRFMRGDDSPVYNLIVPAWEGSDQVVNLLSAKRTALTYDDITEIAGDDENIRRRIFGLALRYRVEDLIEFRRKIGDERVLRAVKSLKNSWSAKSYVTVPPNFDDIVDEITDVERSIFSDITLDILEESGTSSDKNPTAEGYSIPQSVWPNLIRIDEYAKANPGQAVSQLIVELFPQLLKTEHGASKLPTAAPELWKESRQGDETPPAFIKRVYGMWLGMGLTRAHIRALDKPLWQALYNWLRHNELPADVDLPTRHDQNSRWLARIEGGGAVETSAGHVDAETLRQARKLDNLRRKRTSDPNERSG